MSEGQIQTKDMHLGNVIALEHINLAVPNQKTATIFYILGLGLTRDPYMSVGHENMWVNIGHQQFHLPTRSQQKIPGTIGLVVPSLSDLNARLANVARDLKETAFNFEFGSTRINITCPWGNQIICSEAKFGSSPLVLGIQYINFDVPVGTSKKIGEFYLETLQATVEPLKDSDGICVRVGNDQSLVFQETSREIPMYDGHHIAIYLSAFKEVYSSLDRLGLVTEVSSDFQYRFENIVDLSTRKSMLKLEHEVRSVEHPMYQRDLVNRNPNQGFSGYVSGSDRFM